MSSDERVVGHYTSGKIWERLCAALDDDGIGLEAATIEHLAPYDQFHGRGLEATEAIAGSLSITDNDHILDVGSGIGGPARYFADRFACRVSGIDLTAEFCDIARRLNERLGLSERINIEHGDALSMPFPDGGFDGAYSMNVAMNIEDKASLYRELQRVIRPGGWLVLSEIAQGPNVGLDFPTPWARTSASSFLSTPEQTRASLQDNGFIVERMEDTVEQARAYGARSKALVDRGQKPLHRAVTLIHGDSAQIAMANSARGVQENRIIPIEIHCVRRGPRPA